jgi:uncharacterized membrane-anchored protein
MGLREATILAVILGSGLVAAADPNPTTAARPARPGAAAPKAERPDPAAQPGAKPAAEAGSAAPDDADADADADGKDEPVLPHLVGPRHVDLGNQTAIELPEGMVLLEKKEAQDLLRKAGDPPDGVVAMVLKPGSDWHVFIEYADSGYVDDSDANDLDASELLDSYREGTKEQNKKRTQLGFPELVIDSWSEMPRYERASHRLIWGIAAHSVKDKSINHFTRILGRSGYLSVDLIDSPEQLESAKKESAPLLAALQFNPGARYEDHTSGDKSSGIGLRGLVLGGAGVALASKLGLVAKLVLVFKKAFIVLFAAIAGAFRWLFRRKRATAEPIARHGGLAPSAPPSPDLSVDPPLGHAPDASGWSPPDRDPSDGSQG